MKKILLFTKIITVLITILLLSNSTLFGQNPLSGLPSTPGSTIDSINNLGEGEWLYLGYPAADPNYGRAFGRSWGGKGMVLIPDRRGAFLTGEGRHEYVKPDGYGADDYWFYDINAHRWICLYPGTDTKNFNNKVKNGEITLDTTTNEVVDNNGDLLPGHLLIHAWGYIIYDTDRKKIAFDNPSLSATIQYGHGYGRYYLPGEAAIDSGLKVLESRGLNTSPNKPMSPWFYNTVTGKFEHYRIAANRPVVGGFPLSLYIPSKKKYFLAATNDVAYFDPSTDKWSSDNPKGTKPSGYDFGGCYDSKRDRVYMGKTADSFFMYDIQTSTFTKIPNPKGYSTNFQNDHGSISYDVTNDVVLIFDFDNEIIYPFNPSDTVWESPITMDTQFSSTHRATNCSFYDQTLGVHFIFTGGDSQDNSVIWVYRYKKNIVTSIKNDVYESPSTLTIYPNPFNTTISVYVDPPVTSFNPTLHIYDMQGKIVADLTNSLKDKEIHYNAEGLSEGLYIIKLNTGDKVYSEKISLVR